LINLNRSQRIHLVRQLIHVIPFQSGYDAYWINQMMECLLYPSSYRYSQDNSHNNNKEFEDHNDDDDETTKQIKWIWKTAFQDDRTLQTLLLETVQDMVLQEKVDSTTTTATTLTENDRPSVTSFLSSNGGWTMTSFARVLIGQRLPQFVDPKLVKAQNLPLVGDPMTSIEKLHRDRYGTYMGRIKTRQFFLDHKIPIKETILHSFMVHPRDTLINHGIVVTLHVVSQHWHRILSSEEGEGGSFTHNRREQLDPIETMQVYMPIVCEVLANLKGKNRWDTKVLKPFVTAC